MLLLYRGFSERRSCFSTFTFHYASTLSNPADRLQLQVYSDLHSTMLLLYRSIVSPSYSSSIIYIPLCFYFILVPDYFVEVDFFIYIPLCFYFISLARAFVMSIMFIYIPLCFYFIAFSPITTWFHEKIYIPLCFYFIGTGNTEVHHFIKFTFHYASTLFRSRLFRGS